MRSGKIKGKILGFGKNVNVGRRWNDVGMVDLKEMISR